MFEFYYMEMEHLEQINGGWQNKKVNKNKNTNLPVRNDKRAGHTGLG